MRAATIVIFVAVALPSFLVVLNAGKSNTQSVLALCAGTSAFSLMALNLFLSTRPRGIEAAVGGLDRLYQLHKWTGITILPLVLFHKFVGMDLDGKIVASGLAKTSVEIAEIAFLILVPLLLLSWIKRLPKMRKDLIPYQLWRMSHRVLGLVFMALVIHQLFVKVPFNTNAMISHYLNIVAAIGVFSFLYTQLAAPLRGRKFTVTAIEKHPAATIIDAQPTAKGFKSLRAGAFAVISFKKRGLREPHPFTISKISDDQSIQFSVRPLGDYTSRIRDDLSVGDTLRVKAGYGRFDYRKGEQNQIWVAGGIGITPFLAFADSLQATDTRQIQLIYSVRSPEDVVGLERLQNAQARVSGFNVHIHASATDGRLDAALLAKITPFDIPSAGLWFCGPAPMRQALVKGLRAAKTAPKSVHFEEFEFR